MGDLLGASHQVTFVINRVAGSSFVFDLGSTGFVNPKVAENNSPLPQDRVSLRYNHFGDALTVTGISAAPPVFDPSIIGFRQATAVKSYDADIYTFSVEKTFCNGLMSAELRVPFGTTLASHLNLTYGQITGVVPGQFIPANLIPDIPFTSHPGLGFNVIRTPQDTLGQEDTEFGNLTLILKGLLYETPHLALSAGASLGIPTAEDTRVRVIDYLGDVFLFTADTQRERDFHITNATWSLSPFVAFLATPTPRLFGQGFLQVEFPLNDSTVTFSEFFPHQIPPNLQASGSRQKRANVTPIPIAQLVTESLTGVNLTPPFVVRSGIDEQTLMHVDLNCGYWLVRNPNARWITGFAPTLELHYTTTLENADIVTLPKDGTFVSRPGIFAANPPAPQVGNLNNRVDILDLTAGGTVLLGDRVTFATGVAAPLRGRGDRTFDWELLLQLNYYFGGPARRSRAPTTF
jgi:hypothetical protein